MNDDTTAVPDAGTSEEPALTQRNTATVQGEEDLSDEASGTGGESSADGGDDAGAAPTYGPAGDTTDAEEEGAPGDHGR